MKYPCEDTRTHELLQRWQEETRVLSLFLWKSGSADQRSFKGLLTSLLYQLLEEDMQSSHCLLKERPILKLKYTNSDWSSKEVADVLPCALKLAKRSFAFFIDGLDEIDQEEGFSTTLKFLDRLTSLKDGVSVKVCLSSRPEPELKR